jgi:DNA-binding MarR family transcriptional regulator
VPSDDVNTRILVELMNVGDITRRAVVRALDKRAVCTLRQFLVMDVIARSIINVSPGTLAEKLGCSRANVTHVLGELRYREWLTFTPTYRDLRSSIVGLSDSGLVAYASYGRRLADVAGRELAPLDVESRRAFGMVLRALAGFRTRL